MAKKSYKSFKLYTDQNIMGVVLYSMLASAIGVVILFGIALVYEPAGQVLGISTP